MVTGAGDESPGFFCGFGLLSFVNVARSKEVLVCFGFELKPNPPLRRPGALGTSVGGVRDLRRGAALCAARRIFGTEALVVQPIDFVRHAAAAKETLSNRAVRAAAFSSRQEPPRGPGSTSTQRQVNQAAAAAPAQAPRAPHS